MTPIQLQHLDAAVLTWTNTRKYYELIKDDDWHILREMHDEFMEDCSAQGTLSVLPYRSKDIEVQRAWRLCERSIEALQYLRQEILEYYSEEFNDTSVNPLPCHAPIKLQGFTDVSITRPSGDFTFHLPKIEDKIMSTFTPKYTDTVTTEKFLFGKSLEKVTDGEIMQAIKDKQAEVTVLEATGVKSTNITVRIEDLNVTIEGLVAELDSEARLKKL